MWRCLLDRSQTDHRLVISKLNLRIQPARRSKGKKNPKILDASKLKQDSKRQAFINDIYNNLGAVQLSSEDPRNNWTSFFAVHSSAVPYSMHLANTKTGLVRMIQGLLEGKHRLHKAHKDDTSSVSKMAAYNICKTVQSRLRDMQDTWLSKIEEETQSSVQIEAHF